MTTTVPPVPKTSRSKTKQSPRKVLIIGSGPAGLTAALYASRAKLEPLVIAGYTPLGQLMITTDVENYPGFPGGILGPELMALFREQAERFGTEIIDKDASKVDFASRPFRVWVGPDEYTADSVIVATGASALWLGLPSEEHFRGRGVSACATCDGFFFRDREIAVVGGGDTALEEALFLTRFASKVTMLVRRDQFRGSKIMQDRALSHPKIDVRWNQEVMEVLGDATVSSLKVRDASTGKDSSLDVQGMFVAIGYKPNTDLFIGQLETDERGYLKVVDETGSRIEGVFVAGDVHDHRYRQAVTAAGDGCKAAIDAERWLESVGEIQAQTATNW
ncbi:MAG: thioredoxin-disulfide reductase [Chloroflexi bacterium]|jgi:thioredoxin reductase (NADPH)|nr:MAG: thioredoxin-disulfide reductase [Chloroflexota bacterium]